MPEPGGETRPSNPGTPPGGIGLKNPAAGERMAPGRTTPLENWNVPPRALKGELPGPPEEVPLVPGGKNPGTCWKKGDGAATDCGPNTDIPAIRDKPVGIDKKV